MKEDIELGRDSEEAGVPSDLTCPACGGALRESRVGRFVVIEPMVAIGSFAPVPPDRWTLTASHRPQEAGQLLDRDVATGWSTGDRQQPGQWIALDLGGTETVARVDLLAIDWQEVPAGFRVEWSREGRQWHDAVTVATYWGPLFLSEGRPFLRVRRGRVQAIFPPVACRFLRIVQLGHSAHAWAARDLGRPVLSDMAASVSVIAVRTAAVVSSGSDRVECRLAGALPAPEALRQLDVYTRAEQAHPGVAGAAAAAADHDVVIVEQRDEAGAYRGCPAACRHCPLSQLGAGHGRLSSPRGSPAGRPTGRSRRPA